MIGMSAPVNTASEVAGPVRGHPLDRLPTGDHREAALVSGLAHDVNGGTQDLGGPVDQASGEPSVGEHTPHRCAQIGLEQYRLVAVAVL